MIWCTIIWNSKMGMPYWTDHKDVTHVVAKDLENGKYDTILHRSLGYHCHVVANDIEQSKHDTILSCIDPKDVTYVVANDIKQSSKLYHFPYKFF